MNTENNASTSPPLPGSVRDGGEAGRGEAPGEGLRVQSSESSMVQVQTWDMGLMLTLAGPAGSADGLRSPLGKKPGVTGGHSLLQDRRGSQVLG